MGRRDKSLRRHCSAVLDQLGLPHPLQMESLCRHVGQVCGRPIILVPAVTEATSPCGVWVSAGSADFILYDSLTSPMHQLHIVLHEVGHIVLGHSAANVDRDDWSRLFPSLDPQLVRLVMGRASYTCDEEREAEFFADIAYERAGLDKPSPAQSVGHHLNPAITKAMQQLSSILDPR